MHKEDRQDYQVSTRRDDLPEQQKKRYHPPRLEDYGSIRNITLGGTPGSVGDSSFVNTWP